LVTPAPRLAVLALLVLCTAAYAGDVVVSPPGPRREARVVVHGCCATVEIVDETLRLRDECPRSQAEKLATFVRLLQALGGVPPAVTSVSVGRLLVTFPDMARAVAAAAAQRPPEEVARGLEGPDHGNRLFAALVDEADALAPLRAALVAQGAEPGAVSVEKVLHAPARETPFAEWLASEGVPPARVVPFDAQVWIRVESAAPE
jgi:hypothetical protein